MTPREIDLTQPQVDSIADQIGGAPDATLAMRGMQLVEVTAWRLANTYQAVGLTPDNAIFDIGLAQICNARNIAHSAVTIMVTIAVKTAIGKHPH